MPQVLIVGAGVIGASVAYHLATLGVRDILVVDRGADFGAGSTPRATGGFRCQFSTEPNILLSLLSREKLRRFEQEIGVDSGYRPCGYLFLTRTEEGLRQLRDAQALQHACGLAEARMVTATEARYINSAIQDDTILGAAHCPTDGFIRASQILRGYADAARRLGVKFEFGVEVRRLRTDGNRVAVAQTRSGEIAAGTFVNAGGAWASTFGINIPVRPLKRQVAVTIEMDLLPETMPMTIWMDDGFHVRVRDRRILLLWPDQPPSDFDTSFEEQWLQQVCRLARERVPDVADIPIDRTQCWAGLYEMSPDRHVLLGAAPGIDNLFLTNGSSGHGVMHAPAIGQLIAEMIVEGKTSIDVRALRPARFAEGEAIEGSELL
jgi:sarcosine oxidase, subunit beta